MNRLLTLLRRWIPEPLESTDFGFRGHVRILELTHQRLVLSICAMPLLGIPFTMWFRALGRHPLGILIWTVAYAVVAVLVTWQTRRFRRELQSFADTEPPQWLNRWQAATRAASVAHAAGLGALGLIVLLTPGRSHFDFVLLAHVTLAVVIVGNATSQLPVVGMFLRMLAFGWGAATAVLPLILWNWPKLFGDDGLYPMPEVKMAHWRFITPVTLMLLIALYRHAVVAHNFMQQQVRMEEQSLRLTHDHQVAKDAAEAALQSKNQFLSTASHDLRQPVYALGLLAESIAVRNRDPVLEQALRDLRQSTQSLNRMCNALLDLSRIESGVVQVNAQTVLLSPMLHEVAALFLPEARARGLRVRVHTTPDSTALADPVLLRQSLINLAHNALRYTVRGGILLAARRAGSAWRVEVWDTGMGVADEEQSHIFLPYYQPKRNGHKNGWHPDSTGHGLGLAVVARCAELMGAGYGITSQVGRGSRFWLQLQMASPGQNSDTPTASLEAVRHRLSGRCLIVEDDPQVANAWHRLLHAWGIEARCVDTAQTALATLSTGFVPNAILCDQRLRSGESGFDVLRMLLKRCPEASGAIVSGEFDAPELRQAEAEGYLVLRKPVDTAMLHTLLTTWLVDEH